MKKNSADHFINADVLIIGGGFSGLWAALAAKEHINNVVIVDNGPVDWGGLGTASGGDFQCVQDTTVEAALDDLVYYYDGLCDQLLLKKILEDSYPRFQQYERLGVHFQRDDEGKLVAIPQRNLKHMKMLLVRPYGTGGPSMRDSLIREANRLNIRRLAHVNITRIIRDANGEAAGAVGFHTMSAETFAFSAKTIILATGNGGWRPSYTTNSTCVGEGAWLAYNAGAGLSHNEFMNIWIQPVLFSWEGQTGLLPLGAILVNKDGEDFMKKYYSPTLGANTDTTYNSRGMAFEARAGRAPFYFDTTALTPDQAKLMEPVRGWAKINYDRLREEYHMKFFGGKTCWMPQIMFHDGGPLTDRNYETEVPGMYAAFKCRGSDPGVYMGGWGLCTTSVTGWICGNNAAQKSLDKQQPALKESEVAKLLDEALAPLKKPGIDSKDLVRETQKIVYPADVCLIKSEDSLNKALSRVERAKDIESRLGAVDARDLNKLYEAKTMLLRAELFVKSSLMRTETRAGHFREDYPHRDNENWLANIVARKNGNGEAVLAKETLPMQEFPIKPYRYYMDNFTFPGQ